MYYNSKVNIPQETHKICFRTIKGTTYVNYEYDRIYIPEKKYTNVKRTTIGKLCEDNPALMYPNANYYKYFPEEHNKPYEIDISSIISILNSNCPNHSKRIQLHDLVKANNNACNAQAVSVLADLCIPEYMMLQFEKAWIPLKNICNLHPETLDCLQNLIPLIRNGFIKGRISEFLFYRVHDVKYAYIVIDEYNKILLQRNNKYKHNFNRFLCSLLLLLSKDGIATDRKQLIINMASSYVKENADRNTFQDLFVIEAICSVDCPKAEELYAYVILHAQEHRNYNKLEHYYESLIKFYKTNKKNDLADETKIELISVYETLAKQYDLQNSSDAIQKRKYLEMALSLIPEKKSYTNKRAEIIRQIEQTGPMIINSMHELKAGPVDVSAEMKELEAYIAKLPLQEALSQLISIFRLKSMDDIKKNARTHAPITQAFFSSTIVDGNGRTVCIVPPLTSEKEEEQIHAYEHYCAEYYNIALPMFITNIVRIINEHHKLDENTLFFLVKKNVYIPENRRSSVLKGLLFGFKGDYISAMHILLPQFENIIRELAIECGINTYNINPDGSIKYFSLSSILESEQFNDILDETILFNLKVFFTSKYGFGMRDKIAHSLLNDDELMSGDSVITWWFMLKIICYGYINSD